MLPFFFSSRRRHTRFSRDWSSDVCSSDLRYKVKSSNEFFLAKLSGSSPFGNVQTLTFIPSSRIKSIPRIEARSRSEERRVGKEGGPWRGRYHEKKGERTQVLKDQGSTHVN